jgi:hypothetical protein
MGQHSPNAKTFIQTMDRFEKTFERFLASPDFKEALITHANHTRAWLYNYQTIKVRLLPGGKWEVNPQSSWSNGKDCIVTLDQVSYFRTKMAEIGEQRDFEDILKIGPEEARRVIEQLYARQEAEIKRETRKCFQYMRQNGHMD